ncbi:MAG TPA: lysophospholipid acyltransferase family protein [Anaerolineales bacterium]|nr:lysophospholipid acyltransferase family protein [Anaerolineales bacterium]
MQVEQYHLAWWRRWITRPLIRGVLGSLLYALAPIKITGKKNVPLRTTYLAAMNHVSLFEAPFVGVCWPEQLEALGASDVWDRPGQNILARMWGGIPVHRGDYDRAAIDSVIGALRNGYALLMAPEGGRSHKPGMRQAKAGIAFIVEQTGVPVVPVAVVGTTDDFFTRAIHGERPQLEMHIGKPFHLPPVEGKGVERRESRQRNADLVMRHIAGMLPPEYRGVYADTAIFQDSETNRLA